MEATFTKKPPSWPRIDNTAEADLNVKAIYMQVIKALCYVMTKKWAILANQTSWVV